MSEKKGFEKKRFETSLVEVKQGAVRYIDAISKVLEKVDGTDLLTLGKEIVHMGYAMGVIAGLSSNCGIEGFTLLLNGIKLSLTGESREEEIHFAIWDIEGNLHTSEEGFQIKKGDDNGK